MKKLGWVLKFDQMDLILGDKLYATVFNNGIWFTWDSDGVGLENSVAKTIDKAMEEAAQSAISQGLIFIKEEGDK